MSFHNQAFWMGKSPGCLNDDMTCDNSSRIESKRAHQWFMDGPEVDLLPNKKQAIEAPNNSLSGIVNSSISSWGNSSSFHPLAGHFTEQLSDPDTATMKYEDANISSFSIDNKSNVERKDNMDPFGSDFSFGLSMSSTLDPQLVYNYDGIRKLEVSEEKESENIMPVPLNNLYDKEVSDTVSNPHAYKGGGSSISMNLNYNKGHTNMISMDDVYGRTDKSLLSMLQSYNKGDDSSSIHQTYKEICNTISIDQGFSKVDGNVTSVSQVYNKADDSSMSRDPLFNMVDDGTISTSHTYCNGGDNISFVSHSYSKGESTIISFGGCDDDGTTPSSLFIHELLMGQTPSHKSAVTEKELIQSDSNLLPRSTTLASVSETESVSKMKDEIKMSKKATSNNFPSNVKSLLSTGMLDGVSVKYKAWSREKELRGVIKGAGYLCSCQSCKFSKVINAYEFERHAGCKTKHPNNHIYFESGKTIYGVVQELRSTPQNMLFEVIQTVTGSPINQKSYRIWKESFMAAARELQRICGKDDVKQLL